MDQSQPRIEIIFQEVFRQTLHSAVALFIIPLRWLSFYYALVFALTAFFWNLFVMPRLFPEALRPGEKRKGYSRGMLVYSSTILILALFFPLPILAGAWAVLSLADGLATLTGKLWGRRSLFWNRKKTWLGFSIFFVSASVFGWLAFLWTEVNLPGSSWTWFFADPMSHWPEIHPGILLVYSIIAGLLSSVIESLPLSKVDDNLTAPLGYALVLAALLLWF